MSPAASLNLINCLKKPAIIQLERPHSTLLTCMMPRMDYIEIKQEDKKKNGAFKTKNFHNVMSVE